MAFLKFVPIKEGGGVFPRRTVEPRSGKRERGFSLRVGPSRGGGLAMVRWVWRIKGLRRIVLDGMERACSGVRAQADRRGFLLRGEVGMRRRPPRGQVMQM